ncbi:hypothetical protein IAR55_006384 [Kwoniella newhampshirensis]|uniref:ATP-dependent Clp protease ATP-binding subunit ClpX n=1 Tax=Kwoniella newhampshirensis TaxID=1651941 RepID=A0AAW0YWW6_9TREE
MVLASSVVYAVVGLTSILSVRAAAYIGCIGALVRYATLDPTATTNQLCFTSCTASGSPFAFIQGTACYCAPVGLTYVSLQASTDAYGTCQTASFAVYNLRSTFQFNQCILPILGLAAASSTTTDSASCFNACRWYPAAAVTPIGTSQFRCDCYNSAPLSLTLLPCARGITFFYGHPAQFSGQARRAMKERLVEMENERKKALCPGRKTACSIPGIEDAFECIDVNTELESCGGCINGTFNDVNRTAHPGTDCTALKGVGRGATTCSFDSHLMTMLRSRRRPRLSNEGVYLAIRLRAGFSWSSATGNDSASFTGWSVRSPKDLYNYLSQYIVGQERAKRVLSVAVFNHYHRIAPRLPSQEPPSPPSRAQPPPIILDPPLPSPPSPRSTPPDRYISPSSPTSTFRREDIFSRTDSPVSWDPSRAGTHLDNSERGDATRMTGADGAGADPTLTHDLLTLRSREGQWARDGYFSARPAPPLPSLLGQALKRRKSPTSAPDSLTATANDGASRPRRRKAGFVGVEEVARQQAVMENEAREAEVKENVVIEKSNVLMVGPTGTGKTLMARTLANILDVPFASCDATTYTQAGSADYDVNRAEVGIIHIDEIDKLARRGGGDMGSWGGGRDVGGEGVQQALLRLLEGTTLTLSAKPPAISSSSGGSTSSPPSAGPGGLGSGGSSSGPKAESAAAYGDPPGWDPNNPMNRGLGGKRSVREGLPRSISGGGGAGGKGETFVVDTTNILFVLSGAFVGLETISIGFGAPLPKPDITESNDPIPLKGLATTDLATYGLIPEFLGRLPILSTLHPLSTDDLVRILVEPRNALIKQYMAMFERYGSEVMFTDKAVKAIARVGLERGGGARGLRGVLEEILVDAMFEVPGSSVRYCLITEAVVRKESPAVYFSRGQRMVYLQAIEDEDGPEGFQEMSVEDGQLRATG